VHATDPEVRARLLGIDDLLVADVRPKLRRLVEGGIRVHAQVVLCPGLNDGLVLADTAATLAELHPGVQSIAVVPLGLTRHRAGLPALEPVTPDFARQVIVQVEALGMRFRETLGHPFIYLADEWFFLTGTPIPPAAYYQDFPQLEDGVGLARRLIERLGEAGGELPIVDFVRGRRATVVTGVMAAPLIAAELVQGLLARHAREVDLVVVENEFLGPGITVSGLLAGGDIRRAVAARGAGQVVCLPPSCVNGRSLFLDDLALGELTAALGVPVHVGLGDEPFHTNPVWEKT
jgi:putative radical SAM enzyme (TIGR03279 family)